MGGEVVTSHDWHDWSAVYRKNNRTNRVRHIKVDTDLIKAGDSVHMGGEC